MIDGVDWDSAWEFYKFIIFGVLAMYSGIKSAYLVLITGDVTLEVWLYFGVLVIGVLVLALKGLSK